MKAGSKSSFGASIDDNELVAEHVCRFLRFCCGGREIWIVRVREKADHCGLGRQLIQQLNVLCRHLADQEAYSRDVAAGSGEAVDNTEPDRVAAHRKDHGHGRGHYRLGRDCGGGAAGRDENVHLSANQIGSQRLQPIMVTFRKAKFDRYVSALCIADFVQAFAESGDDVRRVA